MTTDDMSNILEVCLLHLEEGRSLEACLADYPDQVEELRPLLEGVQLMRQLPQSTPSAAQIKRMEAMMGRKLKPAPRRAAPTLKLWTWVTVAAVSILVIVLVGFFLNRQDKRDQPAVFPTRRAFGSFHTRTPTPTDETTPATASFTPTTSFTPLPSPSLRSFEPLFSPTPDPKDEGD